MPMVKLSSTSISYRERGEGWPALLLVHGAGGSAQQFAELMALLAERHRVVALDLPGHGRSAAPGHPVPPQELLESYRDAVNALAERLGLGRYVLIGHSMGGAVAQQLVVAHPERVAALGLLASAARLRAVPGLHEIMRQRFAELPAFFAAYGYSPASDRRQVERWARLQLQAPQAVVSADFLACAAFDLRGQLHAVSCPTLVLAGADDRLTPPALQAQLAASMPRATLCRVERAGHFVHLERPDAVAGSILEWLHACV